jgi:hypothetical protein
LERSPSSLQAFKASVFISGQANLLSVPLSVPQGVYGRSDTLALISFKGEDLNYSLEPLDRLTLDLQLPGQGLDLLS